MSWIRNGDHLKDKSGKDNSDFIDYGSPWYNRGTCNSSITGTVDGGRSDGKGRPGATVLDNCVGFANGAFNETFVMNKLLENSSFTKKEYFKFTCNANKLIERAKDFHVHPAFIEGVVNRGTTQKEKDAFLSSYVLPPTAYPPEGGLIVWGGKKLNRSGIVTSCNHVAYISKVIDKDNIIILQSGYQTPGWTTKVDGGYKCNKRPTQRDRGGKNLFWYNGYTTDVLAGETKCLGFIANPGVTSTVGSSTPPVVENPIISSINQPNATSVVIAGDRNSGPPISTKTQLYYKWDGDVSISHYDGIVTTYDKNFNETITKPREAKTISIIPVASQGNDKYIGNIAKGNLNESYPCAYISNGSGSCSAAVPYIYDGKKWHIATPTMNYKNKWYELYNSGKEGVK